MIRRICYRGGLVSVVDFLEHGLIGVSKSMRMETCDQQKVRETGFRSSTVLALGIRVHLAVLGLYHFPTPRLPQVAWYSVRTPLF